MTSWLRCIQFQRGISLIEVMIGIAIAGTLAAGVATVYANLQDNITFSEAQREVDGMRTYVQGIMNQPALCSDALRSGAGLGGGPITWPTPTSAPVTVGHIEVDDGTGVKKMALTAPMNYSYALQINRIYLREPNATEGGPAQSTVVRGGVTYSTVSAKLSINAQTRSVMSGGTPLREKTVDLVVARSPAGVITFCASQENIKKPTSTFCGPATLTAGQPACTFDVYCKPLYYYSGFDSVGKPICSCQNNCVKGPRGPPGAGKPKPFP